MTDALILSNALDTNGQNARYVRASQRYGEHEAVLNALALGKIDPAGVVYRLQEAAEKHPELGLHIRSAHKQNQYFEFPNDLQWGHDAPRTERKEVRRLAIAADVIHLNNSERGLFELGLQRGRKPALLHHHGSLFRSNPPRLLGIARQYKMMQAVSTIDLQKPSPDELHWLPTAYDVSGVAAYGRDRRREPDGRVRIGHFPTNRKLKHTDLFLRAIEELQAEGLPIDLVLVEFVTNAVAMEAKATCDIVYDQLAFGYGCNSVEAWCMGIPVIAGADEWTLHRMAELWGGQLPFIKATEKSLKAVIKKAVQSEQMRHDAGLIGLGHVKAYHDELPALTILAELYRDAILKRNVPRIQGKGVTFVSNRAMRMHVDGQEVHFKHGKATVTDEVVVEKLRQTAKGRPQYGIKEEDVA